MVILSIVVGISILITYAIVFLWYYLQLRALVARNAPEKHFPQTTFTVVLPFRNEEENLPDFLEGLASLSYPENLCQIIFIDDHSTDRSHQIVQTWCEQIRPGIAACVTNHHSGKKSAINMAVSLADNSYIVCSDVDCKLPTGWLLGIDSFIQENKSDLVVLPVVTKRADSVAGQWQELDFLALIATTFGAWRSPVLCNGANMCFRKESFLKIKPFADNLKILTGDDVFLLHSFKKNSLAVHCFLDESVWVHTAVCRTVIGFWEQRVRWGSKAVNYRDFRSLSLAILVLCTCTWLCGSFFLAFNIPEFRLQFLGGISLKLLVDFLLLKKAASYFHKNYLLKWILPFGLIYIFYVPLAALTGLARNIRRYR